ncbi:hypothetical protein [Pseudomonas prosekii]|uniref:hypothetical protein n=1 Tax=Pseudomonas prosekii TaxID=1148509 RepID=UPI0011EB3157|nr:hypothetical protein [Pseudomonas prosekii]
MTNDHEVWFVLTFGDLFFGLGFISIFGHVYLYFFQMQKIMGFLSNSQGVLARKSFLSGGLAGIYFVLIGVGSFLVFPSWAIKSGALDKEDYLSFPRGLLGMIRFFYIASLGSGVSMIVFLIGRKYMGWIE